MNNEEERSLEETLAQVEQCIAQLENPQISLEDSFGFYEEGIRKLKFCNEKVDLIEKKMQIINERGEPEREGNEGKI
uniref:Exodeoxyribonuclease 7 small subunit n=1 Tax=Eubacterium plexicaudatum ASF492 TaxID=1235802 RepID=N2A8T5_9FIRM